MTKFCGVCGSPLPETAIYCGGCGAAVVPVQPASRAQQPGAAGTPTPPGDPANWATVALPTNLPPPANPDPVVRAQAPAAFQPPPPAAYVPAPAGYTPGVAYPAKKSNTLLKIVLAVVVLLCVGSVLALAGLYYGVQMLRQKIHQVAAQELGEAAFSVATIAETVSRGIPAVFSAKRRSARPLDSL